MTDSRIHETKKTNNPSTKKVFDPTRTTSDASSSNRPGLDGQNGEDQESIQHLEENNSLKGDGHIKEIEKKQKRTEVENVASLGLKAAGTSNDSNSAGGSKDNDGSPEHGGKKDKAPAKETAEFWRERLDYINRIIEMYKNCVADVSYKEAQLKEEIHRMLSEDTPANIRFRKRIEDALESYNSSKSISKRKKKYFIEVHGFFEERYGYIKNKVESKNFVSRQIYLRLWGSHAAELRKIEGNVHRQFLDQKYQKLATIESKRFYDSMIYCLRELQLDGEMNDPGLRSLLMKHGEHVRKITLTTARFLADMDKKYLDEREKSVGQKLWKVRSKELAESYKDALLEFAALVESSRTDNTLTLLNAHVSKLTQTCDTELDMDSSTDKNNKADETHTHDQNHSESLSEDIDHIALADDQKEEDGSTSILNKGKSKEVSFDDQQTNVFRTYYGNDDIYSEYDDFMNQREGLYQKLAKDEGYDFSKEHESTGKRVWRVFNRLKASVLTFSPETEHEQNLQAKQDLQLRQEIEQRLRSGDQKYLEHVKKLLDSHEVDQDVKDYFIGEHNKDEIYVLKKSKDSEQKVWRVYNTLTQSVFTLSKKPEEHSALQQEIKQKMETDEEYRGKVETLLASREINDELADKFAEIHGKVKEREAYQKNLRDKKTVLNEKAMNVYKLLVDSVFLVSPDEQADLQWEIERRLTGTSQVDRLYQRKIEELLAAGKVTDEDKTYLAKFLQKVLKPSNKGKKVTVSPPNEENEISLQVLPTSTNDEVSSSPKSEGSGDNAALNTVQHGDGSEKRSGKINQKLKWYFANTHSKYTERYHFIKMEEAERRKSFKKRLFRDVYEKYKREELKEKIHHGQSYKRVVDNLTRDLRSQMRYLQGQFTPENKEQRIMIYENLLQSMVHLEVMYLGSMIKDRASTRVNQLESKAMDQFSSLLRSVPMPMWAMVGTTAIGHWHPRRSRLRTSPNRSDGLYLLGLLVGHSS